jgi:hypothetical protein
VSIDGETYPMLLDLLQAGEVPDETLIRQYREQAGRSFPRCISVEAMLASLGIDAEPIGGQS